MHEGSDGNIVSNGSRSYGLADRLDGHHITPASGPIFPILIYIAI